MHAEGTAACVFDRCSCRARKRSIAVAAVPSVTLVPVTKQLAATICWAAASVCGAVYLVVLPFQDWAKNGFSFIPYPWTWWLIAGAVIFFVAWVVLSWKPKPASAPTPAPRSGVRSSVPGRHVYGRLAVEKKIGTDALHVKWADNGVIVGYLVPSTNRGGWQVLDHEENELTWAGSPEEGAAYLERHAP